MDGDGWRLGIREPEVGSQARELKMMSFFEDAPSPPPSGFMTVEPSASLPVQVGTESGSVTLLSVLRLQLAGFQQ
jgi:hypothetical protein